MSPDRVHHSRLEHVGTSYRVTVLELGHHGMGSGMFKAYLAGLTLEAESREVSGVKLFDVDLGNCLNALEVAGKIEALRYAEDNKQNDTVTFEEREVLAEIR